MENQEKEIIQETDVQQTSPKLSKINSVAIVLCLIGLVIGGGLGYILNPNNGTVKELKERVGNLETQKESVNKEKLNLLEINTELHKEVEKTNKYKELLKDWALFSANYDTTTVDSKREFEYLEKINIAVVVKSVTYDTVYKNYLIVCQTGDFNNPITIACLTKKMQYGEIKPLDALIVHLTNIENSGDVPFFAIDYYKKS